MNMRNVNTENCAKKKVKERTIDRKKSGIKRIDCANGRNDGTQERNMNLN